MNLKLISFKLCPFVQQVSIALNYKNISHEIEYIDLSDPPDWFLELSPLKKVPVFIVDGFVLFDSIAINEFIEDSYPIKLHSDNLKIRAQNRAWIEFIDTLTWNVFHLTVKETKKEYLSVCSELHSKLDELESVFKGSLYFNGNSFSLVDVNIAPLFLRLEYIDSIYPSVFSSDRHPRISMWKSSLLEMEILEKSSVSNLKELYYFLLGKRQGFISKYLDPKYQVKPEEKSIY